MLLFINIFFTATYSVISPNDLTCRDPFSVSVFSCISALRFFRSLTKTWLPSARGGCVRACVWCNFLLVFSGESVQIIWTTFSSISGSKRVESIFSKVCFCKLLLWTETQECNMFNFSVFKRIWRQSALCSWSSPWHKCSTASQLTKGFDFKKLFLGTLPLRSKRCPTRSHCILAQAKWSYKRRTVWWFC